MTDELRVHWDLHEADELAVEHEQRLAHHPERRRALQGRVAAARAALEALDHRVAESVRRRRELDREIAAFDEQQHHFEQQQQAIADAKAYAALEHEIAAVREKRGRLEDEALERLDAEEREAAARPEKAHLLERAEAEAGEGLAALEAEATSLRAELAALEARREAACARLSPAGRQRYERLRAGRAGRAVAAIENQACGACHRGLPPAGLQAARRRETLLTCDGCGRLLLLPPEDGAGA